MCRQLQRICSKEWGAPLTCKPLQLVRVQTVKDLTHDFVYCVYSAAQGHQASGRNYSKGSCQQ